jgi:uncharacterized membrane protein HdeD (DUF308 family)
VRSRTSPTWMRTAQIGLGALAIFLPIIAITFPGLTFISLVIVLAIVLFIVGIEKIIAGIFVAHRSKFATIGLGVLTIIVAGLALAFPLAAALTVVLFLAIALMMDGFARIIEGIMNKANRGRVRAFSVRVGILSVAISVLILMTPAIGAIFASFIVGIALLIIGIYVIAAGLPGRAESVVPPTAV